MLERVSNGRPGCAVPLSSCARVVVVDRDRLHAQGLAPLPRTALFLVHLRLSQSCKLVSTLVLCSGVARFGNKPYRTNFMSIVMREAKVYGESVSSFIHKTKFIDEEV
jgi:hypothetical protein